MSYLEKFQATDAWRNKLKHFLFTERKPQVASKPPSASSQQLPQRLSFELSEDLQVILEEKKIPRDGLKMPRVRDAGENKENFEERLHYNTPTKPRRSEKGDLTLIDEPNDALQVTNTSFETLEQMCEKTASDPDSTLFRYLDRGSTSMSQTVRFGKQLSYDEEADALQRLLDELNVEKTEKRLEAQSLMNDTQLDEIEAPSRFWEITLTAETLQLISPVKMVGLMRQSTIMEECSNASESEASSTSYQSAMKTAYSSETTGCYETASETVDEQAAAKKISINSSGASMSGIMELFQQRHSKHKFFNDDKEDPNPLEKSLQLIDLETTFKLAEPQSNSDSPQSPEPEESAKSSSESLDEEDETSLEPLQSTSESTQFSKDESSSVIELSDDESVACGNVKKIEYESILNRSFTIDPADESETKEDDEKSLHFNDTMEEVEYMMKKGMQYLEAAKPSPAKSHLTPLKRADRYRSPSPMLSSPITPKTVISKPKPINRFALDMKPIPKMELFKKPQPSGLKAPLVQNKFVSSLKKQQYAHVISPIGAYIHKTPTTPFMSNIKNGGSESATTSKAFKQLDYDSRVTPHGAAASSISKESAQKNQICSLPKKAYISSEYKQIVDKRTQYTIPGGPKIQQYLACSMIPAVVCHEGKAKLPSSMKTSDMKPPAPRRTEDSLADLSLMSGDVSVYTIKDAQKF